MTNRSVRVIVYEAVRGTVFDTLSQAVARGTWWDLGRAVEVAVFRAVDWSVSRVVRGAVMEDRRHLALQEFLREVTA